MSDQFFYLFSAILLGTVIGALIMYFVSGKSKNSAKNIAAVEEKLNNYQQDVVQHFEQTADLVDELTQSYKKVFDHLGQSARQLLTDEQVQEQIEKRKNNKVTLAFLTDDNAEAINKEQPNEAEENNNGQEVVENKLEESKGDKVEDVVEELTQQEKDIEELVEEIEAEMEQQDTRK